MYSIIYYVKIDPHTTFFEVCYIIIIFLDY